MHTWRLLCDYNKTVNEEKTVLFCDKAVVGNQSYEAINSKMIANVSRVGKILDLDELVFWRGQVQEAARGFAELAERFRHASSRSRSPSILKHDVNNVFAVQAGELLCQSWSHGMLSVYRPRFFIPAEGEARLRYVFSWFTFIRWHLAPTFNSRFRADWRSEFAPEMDQFSGQMCGQSAKFTTQVADDDKELLLWRLGLYAEVQATACVIFVEELERLFEAIDQRLGQLPKGKAAGNGNSKDRGSPKADPATILNEAELADDWREAREAGVHKSDFANDNAEELKKLDDKYSKKRPTPIKRLDALLDRVNRRKR